MKGKDDSLYKLGGGKGNGSFSLGHRESLLFSLSVVFPWQHQGLSSSQLRKGSLSLPYVAYVEEIYQFMEVLRQLTRGVAMAVRQVPPLLLQRVGPVSAQFGCWCLLWWRELPLLCLFEDRQLMSSKFGFSHRRSPTIKVGLYVSVTTCVRLKWEKKSSIAFISNILVYYSSIIVGWMQFTVKTWGIGGNVDTW